MKSGITMLIYNKNDIEFVTELNHLLTCEEVNKKDYTISLSFLKQKSAIHAIVEKPQFKIFKFLKLEIWISHSFLSKVYKGCKESDGRLK